MKQGLLIAAAVIALPIAVAAYSTFSSIVSAPSRVINKTLQTDNIVQSYEWFHDVNAQFNVRAAQVAGHKTLADAEKDASERVRLRIELSSLRASCLDLANRFNANSAKVNKSIFKHGDVPETLNPASCQ